MTVYSFDVFDTCITRMHAYPRDLFYDLGMRLALASANDTTRHRFARQFQRARIRAEKIANWRVRAAREHADIFEIYHHVHWLMRFEHTPCDLAAAELALEEKTLYAIAETVARIDQLRMAGNRIIFISDMYIPGRLLGPLLTRKGLMQEGDSLYVSCDVGVSKHSGKLFDHVLAQEKLAAGDLLHTGDNLDADIHKAAARGIRTCHFTAAHLSPREAHNAGRKLPRSPGASWLAAFGRRCRLAMRHEHGDLSHPLDGAILGVIIPFLLTYVLWVLDDARKRSIKRLYFVARDGEILFKIAKALNPRDLELRYLYGSRRAWLPMAADPGSHFWRNALAVPGQSNSHSDIVARTGLEDTEQEAVRTILGMSEVMWKQPLSGIEARNFIQEKLLANQKIVLLIKNRAESKRSAALAYFRQEDLLSDASWALVDAGWALNCQAALQYAITRRNPKLSAKGYYIGLSTDHLRREESGEFFHFSPVGSILSRRRVVIEHFFLPSTHGSTIGYQLNKSGSSPCLGNDHRDESYLSFIRRLHDMATSCARMVRLDPALTADLRSRQHQALTSAGEFITSPRPIELREMSDFYVSADMRQEGTYSSPLLEPMRLAGFWSVVRRSFSKNKAFSLPAQMWLEGSIALSSSPVRASWSLFSFVRKMVRFSA